MNKYYRLKNVQSFTSEEQLLPMGKQSITTTKIAIKEQITLIYFAENKDI
jgi:hypothetical protein